MVWVEKLSVDQLNKLYSYLLKFICLELWIFAVKVLVVVIGLMFSASFVQEGHVISDILMRHPYRWDFETMIASIYIFWGIYLWKASKEPDKHQSIISFTIYANLFHGMVMFVQALIRTYETARLLGDMTHLFFPAFVALLLSRYIKKRKINIKSTVAQQ